MLAVGTYREFPGNLGTRASGTVADIAPRFRFPAKSCNGRMKLIALVTERNSIARYLAALAEPRSQIGVPRERRIAHQQGAQPS